MATRKFKKSAKAVAPTLFDETATIKVAETKRTKSREQLQEIVDVVVDARMKFVKESFIEAGLVTVEELEYKESVKGVFNLWREVIRNIKVYNADGYFKLKDRLIDMFGTKEFEYWMHGEFRYLQSIVWLIIKSPEFCMLYKINRRKALRLMAESGWDYIMNNFNQTDGWELEVDRQSKKFREEYPGLFLKPDTGRAYYGLGDFTSADFTDAVSGDEAIVYKALAAFSMREVTRREVVEYLADLYEEEDAHWVINTYIDEWQGKLKEYVEFLNADEEEEVEDVEEEVVVEEPKKSSTSKKVEKDNYSVEDLTTKKVEKTVVKEVKKDDENIYFKGRKLAKFIKLADKAYEYESGDEPFLEFLIAENFSKRGAEKMLEEMINLNKRQFGKFLTNFQTRITTVRGKLSFK